MAEFIVPVNFGGNISLQYEDTTREGGGTIKREIIGTAFNLNGYIWQPWFSRFTTGLNFRHSTGGVTSGGGSNNQEGSHLGGNLSLRILPASTIPFSLDYDVRNFDQSDSLSIIDPSYATTSLTVKQSVRRKNMTFTVGFTDRERDNEVSESTSDDSTWLEMSYRIPRHAVRLNIRDRNADSISYDREDLNVTAGYNYRPSQLLALDNRFSQTDSTEVLVATGTNVTLHSQLYSQARFYSPNRKVTLRGNLIIREEESDMAGILDDSEYVARRADFRYRLTSFASVNLSSARTEENNVVNETNTGNIRLDRLFRSREYDLRGFKYNMTLGGEINSIVKDVTGSGSSSQMATSLTFSHRAKKKISQSKLSSSSLQIYQNLHRTITKTDADDINSANLRTNIQYMWRKSSSSQGSMSVTANLGDTRDMLGESETQLANLQLTSKRRFNRRSSLRGYLTFQQRQAVAENSVSTSSTGTYASLEYGFNRPFALQRVNFTSSLHINHSSSGLLSGEEIVVTRWRNSLNHKIGMLHTRVVYDLGEDQDGAQSSKFQIKISRVF